MHIPWEALPEDAMKLINEDNKDFKVFKPHRHSTIGYPKSNNLSHQESHNCEYAKMIPSLLMTQTLFDLCSTHFTNTV